MTSIHTFKVELDKGLSDKLEFDGGLQLKKIGNLIDGTPYYNLEGDFISPTINIGDNFKSFDSIQLVGNTSNVVVSVRTSNNGSEWGEWGSINTAVPSLYLQVKMTLKANVTEAVYRELDFITRDETNRLTYSEFIEYVKGLKLKTEYGYLMNRDDTWTDTGSLHRKKITRSDWLRIDKMEVDLKDG